MLTSFRVPRRIGIVSKSWLLKPILMDLTKSARSGVHKLKVLSKHSSPSSNGTKLRCPFTKSKRSRKKQQGHMEKTMKYRKGGNQYTKLILLLRKGRQVEFLWIKNLLRLIIQLRKNHSSTKGTSELRLKALLFTTHQIGATP